MLSAQETEFLNKEVQHMLLMKAIRETTDPRVVTSSIYTVPKKDSNKRRPVINLRWVNSHLKTQKFKMTTMKDVKAAITANCWMTKMDLTDCFWGLPVHEDDQRFLAFRWQGKTYQFTCLPFGLAPSPMYITKLYRHVVQHLQEQGHRLMIYIDDLLILGDTAEQCKATTDAVSKLLKDLGAIINEEKSVLQPTQKMEYLGFVLDSTNMVISAPKKKINNTRKAIRQVLNKPATTARHLASVLGKINSMADAMFPTRVHTTGLEEQKIGLLAMGWDFSAPLTLEATQNLTWWNENMFQLNGRPLIQPTVDLCGATDASDYGWGAWIETPQGLVRWGGLFTKELANEHINYKELTAVYYMLTGPPTSLRDKVVRLGIDNTTAMWYLRKMGGTNPKLARLAQQIFSTLNLENISLEVYHLPGIMNQIADAESRETKKRLWDCSLDKNVFHKLNHLHGPFSMDIFATYQNKQLPRFASLGPQPGTLWTDAMAHSWQGEHPWVFPPPILIGRILQKLEFEQSSATILTPLWPSQPWWPMLLRMRAGDPTIVLPSHHLLRHPLGDPPMLPWAFVAWTISGSPSARRAMTNRQFPRCSRHGPRRLTQITTGTGRTGRTSPEIEARIQALNRACCLRTG